MKFFLENRPPYADSEALFELSKFIFCAGPVWLDTGIARRRGKLIGDDTVFFQLVFTKVLQQTFDAESSQPFRGIATVFEDFLCWDASVYCGPEMLFKFGREADGQRCCFHGVRIVPENRQFLFRESFVF